MSTCFRFMGLLVPCVFLWLSTVHAQSRSDLERAEASFRAGAAAYAAGDYPAAIQALDAAYTLTPLPAIGFSLAQAERRQYFVSHERSHLERAVSLFRGYIEQVQTGGRRADALDALSQLEPLLAALPGGQSAGSAPASTQRTRVMITCEAPEARVAIDGTEAAPAPLIREVEPGNHQVVVEAAGFQPVTRTITALQGELILSEVTLSELPSTLILSTPADAEIFVDGNFAHAGGARVLLSYPSGNHQLAVAARGQRVEYRNVALSRGQTTELEVKLQATARRTAARALFIAGGAGLGVGLVLGVFALRDQGRAENFLAKQDKGNVSHAELRHYHDDATQRDRYRLGAIATFSVSASMFVTALLLHQLDRPDALEIQRRAPSGEARASQQSAPQVRLQLAPTVSSQAWGAALFARF